MHAIFMRGSRVLSEGTFFFYKRADDGSTLNADLVTLPFSGDPDQYYLETLYFVIFSGGGGSLWNPACVCYVL